MDELQAILLSEAASQHGSHSLRGVAIPAKRTSSFLHRHSEVQALNSPLVVVSPSPRTSCGSDASFPGGRAGSMCHSPSGVTLLDAGGPEECGEAARGPGSHGSDPRRGGGGGENVRSSAEMGDSVRAMRAALAGKDGRRSLMPQQGGQRPEVSNGRGRGEGDAREEICRYLTMCMCGGGGGGCKKSITSPPSLCSTVRQLPKACALIRQASAVPTDWLSDPLSTLLLLQGAPNFEGPASRLQVCSSSGSRQTRSFDIPRDGHPSAGLPPSAVSKILRPTPSSRSSAGSGSRPPKVATFMQYEVFLPPGRTAGGASSSSAATAPSRLSIEADARILGASSSAHLPSRLSMEADGSSAAAKTAAPSPETALSPKPPAAPPASSSGRNQPSSSLMNAILPSILRKKLSQEK